MTLRVQALRTHDPGYPRRDQVGDWRGLLAPGAERVYHPRALAMAALLGVALLLPFAADAGELHGKDEAAVRIAQAELDATPKGSWSDASRYRTMAFMPGNPHITVPVIPISFGNSFTGVIDQARALDVTRRLFQAYGADVIMASTGPEVWDPTKKVGLDLLHAGESAPDLDRTKAEIQAGGSSILTVPYQEYAVMDGDAHPATRAYLQTVLDYLDWLRQQGRL